MDDKQKISAILTVILTAVVALLAVFGYDVRVIQPRETTLTSYPNTASSATTAVRITVNIAEIFCLSSIGCLLQFLDPGQQVFQLARYQLQPGLVLRIGQRPDRRHQIKRRAQFHRLTRPPNARVWPPPA